MHLTDLRSAQTALSTVLSGLTPADWSRPPPCEDWDVATATGRRMPTEDAVAQAALDASHQLLEQLPPGRTPFAAPQVVSDDAPALDRLVALLGRSPGREVWS